MRNFVETTLIDGVPVITGMVPFLAYDDLDITDCECELLVRRFGWAIGLDSGSSVEIWEAVREDVRGDASLCLALGFTPLTLACWLEQDDAGIYCVSEVLRSEDWIKGAVARCDAVLMEWPEYLRGAGAEKTSLEGVGA